MAAMAGEISLRRPECEGIDASRATLYFGGGTPSLLSAAQIDALAGQAVREFGIGSIAEFTIEANPDDLAVEYLKDLRNIGATRISIGVQAFYDDCLRFMRRRHDARQAAHSIRMAQKAGFDNISIDLIYGLPHLSLGRWRQTLRTAFGMGIQHLSAYCLTAEPHTPLSAQIGQGAAALPPDSAAAEQYRLLRALALRNGWEHYETSNFALPRRYALHNANYWRAVPYVGIGAAAHSCIGGARRANIASIERYVRGVQGGGVFWENETLTPARLYNEMVLKGLRTQWGVDAAEIAALAGSEYALYFQKNAERLLRTGRLERNGTRYCIPRPLWFTADGIIVELIWA